MGNNFSSLSVRRFPALSVARQTGITANVTADITEVSAEVSDENLLASIVAGELEDLTLLFRRYARMVHALGCRILRDPAEADDLVQEVFLYVYRKSALFDSSKGSARSWIFQVAYTQAFLRRRQLKSRGFYSSGIADRSSETDPRTSSGADYDHSAEGLFGRNGWREILEQLTADQRETLLLHFFEGYTLGEIGEKLGQSHVNVRHHYYRGLDKIRRHISESELRRR
jgi:RNA polymerase sigma-70 factor (ECF subfamily)